MAVDVKYGAVQVERGRIGDDEVVVVFRAQDANLGTLLAVYKGLCDRAGSPTEHLENIDIARKAVARWQQDHIDQVKIPD